MSSILSIEQAHRSLVQSIARAKPVRPQTEETRFQPAFVVTLSPQTVQAPSQDTNPLPANGPPDEAVAETEALPDEGQSGADAPAPPAKTDVGSKDLNSDEEAMIIELAQRDRTVHAHESAHQSAGGGLVGAASYTYQVGPDGRSYAIGGECPIQMSGGQTPGETISIAQRVRAAALAPANPSGQDMAVANAAAQMEMQARVAASQTDSKTQTPGAQVQTEPKQKPPSQPGTPTHDTDVQLMTARKGPPSPASAHRAIQTYAQATP